MAPRHLDQIHEKYLTILFLVDGHGYGAWQDCYCGRCGANSFVNKDSSYRPVFIKGLKGISIYLRQACKKPDQTSLSEVQVLEELDRRPVSPESIANLRKRERMSSHSPIFFVADGKKRHPSDGVCRQIRACLFRWLARQADGAVWLGLLLRTGRRLTRK